MKRNNTTKKEVNKQEIQLKFEFERKEAYERANNRICQIIYLQPKLEEKKKIEEKALISYVLNNTRSF